MRRGYEVWTGVPGGNDADLIGIKFGERLCLKVSGIIDSNEALLREAAPLHEIRDGSERLILAKTRKPEQQYEGIRVPLTGAGELKALHSKSARFKENRNR